MIKGKLGLDAFKVGYLVEMKFLSNYY